ncbi:STAS/SEC14 domain-containing protein [Sphingomonas sp. DT-207]|uniref:STAS/SEC14 domain-containing protein n=1 Tax=Sphingomonas sp. DT-207 TaxID=3396167 RepID=UPI003F1C8507
MLTITPLSSRAIEIVAEGRFTAADVGPALNRLWAILDDMPKLDILADVRGSPSIALSAITEELKHLPSLFRLIRQVERVAIVADAGWVRAASRIESALIPGLHYEVYERHEAAHAREWLLRHTDVAHPSA